MGLRKIKRGQSEVGSLDSWIKKPSLLCLTPCPVLFQQGHVTPRPSFLRLLIGSARVFHAIYEVLALGVASLSDVALAE